jgi:peptidoglycan/LPS O-acetylase OafA/YrhL
MWLSGGRAPWWQVFFVALPATAALAFLSWHLVERPMLGLKPGAKRGSPRREGAHGREGWRRGLLPR